LREKLGFTIATVNVPKAAAFLQHDLPRNAFSVEVSQLLQQIKVFQEDRDHEDSPREF